MKIFNRLLFLFFLLIPFCVFANDFEYTIMSKVNNDNKDIEAEEFTFQLIDSDGNVIQTKMNDEDGNIIFDPITFTVDDLNYNGNMYGYKFYRIKQVEIDSSKYKYDIDEAYVGVYLVNDGSSSVNYLKNIDEQIEKWTYKVEPDESKIYHATDEELTGQAYAVLDYNDGTLIFFRDEPGKYTNNQQIYYDNDTKYKTYYTGFEDDTLFIPWRGYSGIKKIVFNDPIRPKKIASKDLSEWGSSTDNSWFYSLDDLEEIENINLLDTSLVDSFNSLFEYDYKLKKLDLSTWDTSNVLDMSYMFSECKELEEVNVENFDTSKVVHFDRMFYRTKVKNFDPTVFETDSLSKASEMFFYDDGIEGLDLSSWTISNQNGTSAIASTLTQLRFIYISNFLSISSNGISSNDKLTILRMAGQYTNFSSNFGNSIAEWFNISNNTLYNYSDLRNHLIQLKDLEAATYVRPVDNLEPSVFNNHYIEPFVEDVIKEISNDNETVGDDENILVNNPVTEDKILIVVILAISSLSLGIYLYKKREDIE